MANGMRVATVKATGEQFVVISLDFSKGQVVCQPDVYGFNASRSTGLAVCGFIAGTQRFSTAEVVIRNVTMNVTLAKTLLAQAQRKENAKPKRVVSEAERAAVRDIAAVVAALDVGLAKAERARRDAFEAAERRAEAKANSK